MAVTAGDIDFRLSGGASNTDPDASLGGVKSSQEVSTAVDQLFDAASAADAQAGDVEYRCVYVHNSSGADTMINATVHLSGNTPLPTTTIDIGVGTAAVNANEQTIADEDTAPTGVTFSAPSSQGAALALGNIAPGEHKAVWLRRTIAAGAGSSANDTFSLAVFCETA